MGKCYKCKEKVELTIETKESFSPNKLCPKCLIQILIENGLREALKESS